jgi:iduronate 2-sulfatase
MIMNKLIHLGLLALLIMTPQSWAKGVHYEVFLLAGQSNMDGRGKTAELTGELAAYATPLPSVKITLSTGGLRRHLVLSQGIEPLKPGFTGSTTGLKTVPSDLFGPEIGFGHTLAMTWPNKHLLLIKCTEGGTNLREDWNPAAEKSLYKRFIDYVRANQKAIEAQGDTLTIRGLLWHQGEGDAGQPAGAYKNHLIAWIRQVRTDLGQPNLPVLIGQVYNNGKRDNIFTDQKAVVAELADTYLVESAGLETFDKGTHFDAQSQIELGRRFATEMRKHLP